MEEKERTFSYIVPTSLKLIVSKYIPFSDIEFKDENFGSIVTYYNTFKPNLYESIHENHMFDFSCINGHWKLAKWLKTEFKLTKDDIKIPSIFTTICRNGDIEMLKWFMDSFEINNENLGVGVMDNTFSRACIDGFLNIAKYLHSKSEAPILVVLVNKLNPFEIVCKRGDLEFAKYLYEKFPILKTDFNVTSTFQRIYTRGLLDMAKWFSDTFDLTERDFDPPIDDAFSAICKRGYLDFAKWFYDKFKLKLYNGLYGETFKRTCENGHFDLAKWLCDTVYIKAHDIYITQTFAYLCDTGNIEFAHWVARKLGIIKNSFTNKNNYLYVLVLENHLELVTWLTNQFKFTLEDIKNINNTEYKKLEVLDRYNLDNIQKNQLFCYAFKKGDDVLTKFFFKEFELSYNNVFFDVEEMLYTSLTTEPISRAEFLINLFRFNKENIDRILKNLLLSFCKSGNTRILNWLVQKFGLDKSYLSFQKDILSRTATMNKQIFVVEYLIKFR